MSTVAEILVDKVGAGKPILTEEALEALSGYARSTAFELLKTSVEEGSIARFGRGVYYIPKRGKYLDAPLPLDPDAVLDKKYITDGTEVYGFRSGLALQNDTGVSNQVPAVLEITTNRETNRLRKIEPIGGYREIILRKPRVPIDASNVESLKLLDVLSRIDPSSLNREEKGALMRMAGKADRGQVVERIRSFPKKTAVSLLESGALDAIPA